MKRFYFCLILAVILSISSFAAEIKTGFADYNGNKVFYQETGKGGNTIIFVHGWTCNSDFWKRSIEAFPERRVIALDLPGHGRSDKPQTEYSMEYFAKSIEAVMKTAKVKKAVLVGHSMGTPVIRQFYRLYPKMTIGLVIVDGALKPFSTKAQSEAFMAPVFADYKKNAPGFVEGMLTPIGNEALKKEIRDAMNSTPEHVGISAMKGMIDESIWMDDKINVPTLAILANNPFWPSDTKEYYTKIAPGMDFRMWQDVSHFLMMEKPELFNKSIRLWLSKNNL